MFLPLKKMVLVSLLCWLLLWLPRVALAAAAAGPPEVVRKSLLSIVHQGRDGEVLGAASGFIVSEQGLVVTSYRTAALWKEAGGNLLLKTADGSPLIAEEVIVYDAGHTVALVRTSATTLPALRLRSDELLCRNGPCYVAAGQTTPFQTGRLRKRLAKNGLVEIEAPLQEGSPGAPVLNGSGEVVAVVAAPAAKPGSPGGAVTAAVVSRLLAEHRASLLSVAWFELGLLYDAEKGGAADAVAAFKEAIAHAPDYSEAYNNLSVIYGRAGKYEESVKVLQQVLKLKPDFAEARFNLGIALTRLGRYAEAVAAFQLLLERRASDADAHYLLAVAYLGLRNYTAAEQELVVLSGLNRGLAEKLEKQLKSREGPVPVVK